MSEDVLIRLDRVSKDYETGGGVVRALREVSLEIARGDFLAIVGASGSGKSTLMNLLGCLDRPTRGTYELAGVEVGARSNDARAIVRNRLIGFVFQGFNLLPRTTALENCELPLQYRGVGRSERKRRAEQVLRTVGLGERMDHTPNQLSGGQQQRVAIARALVTDPPVLLADEPTGNLDTRTSLEVLALLQRLNEERGITIILVTHETDIAACAKRVITVRDGRIVSDARNDPPVSAEAALRELPPPQKETSAASEARGARADTRPVPLSAYLSVALGALLGGALGYAYNALVLGAQNAAIPLALALAGEAYFAARAAKGRSRDRTADLALWYTVGQATLVALGLALFMPRSLARHAAALSSGGVALALGGGALALLVVFGLRYGLLSLVSRRARA